MAIWGSPHPNPPPVDKGTLGAGIPSPSGTFLGYSGNDANQVAPRSKLTYPATGFRLTA